MARKMKIETNYENGTNTFIVLDSNGEPHPDFAPYVSNVNDHSEAMRMQQMLHGNKQRLSDAFAYITEPKAIIEAIAAGDALLLTGNWRAPAKGGGVRLTLLARDVMTATGKDQNTVVAWLANMSKADRQAKHDSDIVTDARLAREKAVILEAEKVAKAKAKEVAKTGETQPDVFAGLGSTSETEGDEPTDA